MVMNIIKVTLPHYQVELTFHLGISWEINITCDVVTFFQLENIFCIVLMGISRSTRVISHICTEILYHVP